MICVRLPCHLRQVMCHVASNHAPICIKKRAVLRQVAIVLSYSCIVISPFQSSFPIFSAFYFPVSCFSIPVFFRCFFDKVCIEIQSVLLSNVPYIFHNILRYSRISIATRRPKPQGGSLLPASRYILEYWKISENKSLFVLQ